MKAITRHLKQLAVYWPPGPPGDDGKPTFGTPVEIKVRWEDYLLQDTGRDGRVVSQQAQVFVDRVLETGGAIRLGPVRSLSDRIDPFKNTGPQAWEVKRMLQMPTRNARRALMWVHI